MSNKKREKKVKKCARKKRKKESGQNMCDHKLVSGERGGNSVRWDTSDFPSVVVNNVSREIV